MYQINHFPTGAVFGPNFFQILFCFICGLLCLIPVCLQISSNIELKPLRQSLSSCHSFTYCSVASVTLIVPLFLDVILDLVVMFVSATLSVKINKQKTVVKDAAGFIFLNIPERMLILVGMIVVPIVAFLPKNTENLALIYVCCNNCQQNLVGGTLLISLSRYDKEYWSIRVTSFSLLFYSMGLVGGSFIGNVYSSESNPTQIILALDSCSYFLTLAPCLLFIVNSLRWLLIVYFGVNPWKKLRMWSSKVQHVPDLEVLRVSDSPDHNFFPMIYVTGGLVILLSFCCLMARAPRPENYDSISLTLNSVPYVCFLILVSILSMRMVKFEVVQGLVSNIFCLFILLRLSFQQYPELFVLAESLLEYFISFSMH